MIGIDYGSDLLPSGFLQLTLKLTLVLITGLATALMLKKMRASATARHMSWLVTLLALLALPPLTALMPPLDLPFLPGATAVPTNSMPVTGPAVPIEAGVEPLAMPFDRQKATAQTLPDAPSVPWAWLIYAAVLTCLLVRLLVAHIALHLLRRQAWEIEDPQWHSLLLRLRSDIGLHRRVRLLIGPSSAMPMAWGMFSATILLPADAMRWSTERRQFVLLHELAHIKRRDPATQTAAALACALYWFHPLVWYASVQLRREQEQACDELVLSALNRPEAAGAYAKTLLDLAAALAPTRLVSGVSVAMARPSEVETRLRAILDGPPRRRFGSRRLGGGVGVAAALLTLPLAAANPMRAAADAAAASSPRIQDQAATARTVSGVTAERERDSIPVRHTVAAEPGGTLTIDIETGAALEIRGWNRAEVSLEGQLGGRDRADTQVDLRSSGGGNVLLTSRQAVRRAISSTSHRFILHVPARYSVDIDSAGGGVRMTGLSGRFTGDTGGGEIVLDRLRGEARLSTGGGDISVIDSTLDGFVSTGGGEVRFERVRGPLRTDGRKPVQVSAPAPPVLDAARTAPDLAFTPPPSDAMLNVDRAGGAIEIESAEQGARLVTGGGDIRLRSARGSVKAETGGGNIQLDSVSGGVTATTGAGAVTLGLAKGTFGGSKDVEVFSGSGPVTIILDPGVGAEFEIETGYTASYGKEARIITDLPLRVSESAGFESVNGGTARQRVFANGRVGSGGYRVRILTVNGDVRILRRGA